jgi:hypothetical protein
MERRDKELGFGANGGIGSSPIVLKQLFDPSVHTAIQEFLDIRVPLMSLSVDEGEFVRKYAHNVPYFVLIHRQLTELACDIFNEKVKPSYSFLSMYKDGGICPLHIDRPQCRYTIDYLIRQDQHEPWPIHIGDHMTDAQRQSLDESDEGHPRRDEEIQARIDSENWHTVELSPNDAVCYSGTHSWHYRSQRLKGTADLVFFHFVPEAFDGQLD